MIKLLSKLFIKKTDDENLNRRQLGVFCSGYGIFLNILLFIGKYIAGLLTASISITADAFNNLSDAGASIVSLIGFKFAGKKPDHEHPFGHGRIEYLSGLAISAIIIAVAIELGLTSIHKITNPEVIDTSIVAIIILVASILIKLYMFMYNRKIGIEIDSAGMKATAYDSISDAVGTLVVLICLLINKFFGINIDGWCGVLVSIFILYSGIKSIKETLTPLLGMPPEKEFVDKIEQIVLSHDEVKGIHDLVVHDYGPGRQMISLHAEVDSRENIFKTHDVIDTIENEINNQLGCETIIHMDPIDLNNEQLASLKIEISNIVKNINENMSIHDLRMVPGETHTNLIFDVVVPYNLKISNKEIKDIIQNEISKNHKNYFVVIHFDNNYV